MTNKILKNKTKKILGFGVLGLIGIWTLGLGVCYAQGQGIGVSPSKVEIAEHVDWPYTVPITVTNFSANKEQFEVFFENPDGVTVIAEPARFLLESGSSKRVFIVFEQPKETVHGLIKVLSAKTSQEGFTTGTGVKIPFSIAQSDTSKFLASANQTGGSFPYIFGGGILLVTIVLLWYMADIVKTWIFNLNKQ